MILDERTISAMREALRGIQTDFPEWEKKTRPGTSLQLSGLFLVGAVGRLCDEIARPPDESDEGRHRLLEERWADIIFETIGQCDKAALLAHMCFEGVAVLTSMSCNIGDIVELCGKALANSVNLTPDALVVGQFLAAMTEMAVRVRVDPVPALLSAWERKLEVVAGEDPAAVI
jgi:hypothetical protein